MTRDLRDTLVIARRELLERVRSKWFAAITLLGPVGMVALIVVSALLIGSPEGSRIEIIDRSGVLARGLVEELAKAKWKPAIVAPDTSEAVEMARIRDSTINGFVTIPADALDGGKIVYRGDNGSNQIVQASLREIVRMVVQSERGKRARLPDTTLAEIIKPPPFDAQQTNGTTEAASGAATFWLGYVVAYLLLAVTLGYAVTVMRSVVQEKTTRVMELMVATVKPRSLMTGKILGVGGAGLLQVAVWLAMGAITLAYRDQILGMFGKSSNGEALPALVAGDIAISLAFFVLGYFFYSSMYAAVGAMVSSEQDAQQVQLPVMLLLLIGFAFITAISSDPRGGAATLVTMLPFWSALLMPMRFLLGGATVVEVVISLAILAISTVLVARAAAKIYRVGVLMYGKRPSPTELLRWLRY